MADLGPLYPLSDPVIANTLESNPGFSKKLLSYATLRDPDKVEIFQSLPTVMSPIGYADNRSICIDYLALIDDVYVGVEFQRQIRTSNHDIDFKRRILANYCHTFASLIKKGSNDKIVPDLEFVTFMEKPLYKGKKVYLRSQLPIIAGYPDHIEILTDENIRMVIHYYQLSELNTKTMENTPFNLILAYLKAKTDQELNFISKNGDEMLINVVKDYDNYTGRFKKPRKVANYINRDCNNYTNTENNLNNEVIDLDISKTKQIDVFSNNNDLLLKEDDLLIEKDKNS